MQTAQKSEFREYLELAGSEDALWKTLIKMDRMEPKPEDPIEYIRQNLDPKLSKHLADLQEQVDAKIEELVQMVYENPKACKKFLKWKSKRSKKARKGKRCDEIVLNKINALKNPVELIPEAEDESEPTIAEKEVEETIPIDETTTEKIILGENTTDKINAIEKKEVDELKPEVISSELMLEKGTDPKWKSNEESAKSDNRTPQEATNQNGSVVSQEKPSESMHIERSPIEPDLIENSNEKEMPTESPTKTNFEGLPLEIEKIEETDENGSETPKKKWCCF